MGCQEPVKPSPEVAPLLASTLIRLPKLQVFTFVLAYGQVEPFQRAIISSAIHALPCVEKLVLGVESEFLIPLCPNVKTIWTDRTFRRYRRQESPEVGLRFISAALQADKLTDLKVVSFWTVDMVKGSSALVRPCPSSQQKKEAFLQSYCILIYHHSTLVRTAKQN